MIRIFPGDADDFSTLGLGVLLPTECSIEWEAGGLYELSLTHPIDDAGRWLLLDYGRIIKAPGPVREAPIVEAEAATETVTREIYKVSTSGGKLRLRAKASTSSKILGSYKPGTEVIRLSVSGDWARVIIRKGGATGWMHKNYLTYVRTETETIVGDKPGGVVEVKQVGEQLFRIHTIERDAANRIVAVQALHISYDLRANSVKGTYSPSKVAAATAVAEIMSRSLAPHLFEAHCYAAGTVTGEYGGKSLIECLLDPESGVVAQTKARIVRDNYDLYLLPGEVRDMGVQLRYGKNLLGASMTVDAADIVTRIEAVGKTKDSKPLYLDGTGYVDSPRIGNYKTIYARRIEYDVQIGKDGITTTAAARNKLRELANADFAAGVDAPAVTLDVDFLNLGDTREYAAYKDLQAVHPYDTVSVEHPAMGISARLRLTKCTWDVLAGRYAKTVFGEIQAIKPTVYGYDLARGSVVGTKIAPDAVDAQHYRDLSIQFAKIDTAAIDTIITNSITALKGRFGEIVADKLTADEMYVALAQMVVLMVQQITADTITTDALYAEMARIITLRVQQVTAETIETDALYAAIGNIIVLRAEQAWIASAEVDELRAVLAEIVKLDVKFADIDHLQVKYSDTDEGLFRNLLGGKVAIDRLSVQQAQILDAVIGELTLVDDDGTLYRIGIDEDGQLTATPTGETDPDFEGGALPDGWRNVASNLTVGEIDAGRIVAQSATFMDVFASTIVVSVLTANEAFIGKLTTSLIESEALQITISERVEPLNDALEQNEAEIERVAEMILSPEQIKQVVLQSTEYGSLSNAVTLAANGLTYVQQETTEIDRRLQTVESGVRVSGSTITLGRSDSQMQNRITHDSWEITESGSPQAWCRDGRLGAQRVLAMEAFILGPLAIRDNGDRHVLVQTYGV